jgi:hypothetical protein
MMSSCADKASTALQDRLCQISLTEISGVSVQFLEEKLALLLLLQPPSACHATALPMQLVQSLEGL